MYVRVTKLEERKEVGDGRGPDSAKKIFNLIFKLIN